MGFRPAGQATPLPWRRAPFSAYVGLIRGLAVDLGFGRFLEMFEERFGKRVTTVLLAIIGIGVLAGCVGLAVQNLILPAINLYNDLDWPASKLWLQNQLLPALISLALLYPLVGFLAFVSYEIYDRTIAARRREKKARALAEKLAAEVMERAKPELEEIQREAKDRLEAMSEDMQSKVLAFVESKESDLDKVRQELKTRFDLARSFLADAQKAINPDDPKATKEALSELLALLEKTYPFEEEKPKQD